jgi:hypothetical protein
MTHVLVHLAPLLLLLVVLTRVLARLAPLLLLLIVMTHVLAPLAPLLQWLVSQCWLNGLVLVCLELLLLLLVVLTRVLAPLAPLLQWLVLQCWLIALILARLAPVLLLLVVLTRVLAPPALILLLLFVLTHVLALPAPLLLLLIVLTHVLTPPAPLLLLLFVLTRVLAQLGLCVHCVVAHCLMIVPNSSLQYWHAFAVDKEPSLLVYNWNEDSFNGTPNSSLLLLIVLTCVLAQLGLCVHCVVAHGLMIVPNSSLQYWHAFAVDKEPSSLVYNRAHCPVKCNK